MNNRVVDGTMVGGFGLIARNGKIIYAQDYGYADRENKVQMNQDTIVRIYSMSKPITAVALMMLYEEGKFNLKDPIAKYIPELANLRVALSTAGTHSISDGTRSKAVGKSKKSLIGKTRKPLRQPTIRDLLTHTAGFTYGFIGNTEVDQAYQKAKLFNNQDTLKDFVTKLGKIPLQYEPGSKWHYSVSVDVQGYLVEVLSGQTFGAFLKERIFDPLEMNDTSFTLDPQKTERLAQLYKPMGFNLNEGWFARSKGKGLEIADIDTREDFIIGGKMESGGGGLLSTTRDYLRFCQMLLNGGELYGKRLLSPKTIAFMTTNHLGDLAMGFNQMGSGFGLGFGVVLDPVKMGEVSAKGEYNWGGAAGTTFWIDPQENVIGIFMVQSMPHRTNLRNEFRVLTYQALVK